MNFTLTSEDKAFLRSTGHTEKDFSQIEKAVGLSIYRLEKAVNGPRRTCTSSENITAGDAIALLGRQKFLAGISRSAFHFTSVQTVDKECFDDGKTRQRALIYFDSHKLFR